MRMTLTKDKVKKDLQKLGLKEGNWILMHSSLKSMGYVLGGANAVIDAFMEIVGEEGLFMVPTFTFENFVPYFEPHHTPSEMGLITETLRQRKESVRSWHPRHSVGVLGKEAKEIVKRHLQGGSVGPGSPIYKLAKRRGYVLLLGVSHTINTTIHTAEVYADLPYLHIKDSPDFPEQAVIKTPAGERIKVDLAPYPTCSEGFWKLEPVMRKEHKIKYGKVGQADCQFMKAQDIIDMAVSLLKKDPSALLCDHSNCYPCQRKREVLSSLTKNGTRG